MTRPQMTRSQGMRVAAVLVVVIAAAGLVFFLWGGSTTPDVGAPRTIRHVAQPAGPNPSESAQMVCAPEAQSELASALGVTTTAVTEPTWVAHVYSCGYMYPDGSMGMSVKELSSRAETSAYFASLRAQLGEAERLTGVAQGAFVTTDPWCCARTTRSFSSTRRDCRNLSGTDTRPETRSLSA